MRKIGITELKASLSETLERVKAGEEMLVTEHGKPIARIAPLESLQARTEDLIRAGVLRAPKLAFDEEFWSLPRPKDPKGLILAELIGQRREGR